MRAIRHAVIPWGSLLVVSLILMNYQGMESVAGQLGIGLWFLAPNVGYYIGTRSASGAPAWMPGLIMLVLQTWMVVDFWRFPHSTAPLILLVGPAYLLVLLGIYLGFLWLLRKRTGLIGNDGE